MAIEGFSPSPHTPSPHSPSPYYQLLERGSARLGPVKKITIKTKYHTNTLGMSHS